MQDVDKDDDAEKKAAKKKRDREKAAAKRAAKKAAKAARENDDTRMNEYVWGAERIGEEINLDERAFYYVAEVRPDEIAGLRKIGSRYCLHVPTWRGSFKGNAG